MRADELMVEKKAAESRSQARLLILAGKVRTGPDSVVQKAGQMLDTRTEFLVEKPPRFVSRGGEKLEGFLKKFPVSFEGASVLDVGASTGGFTDCALQCGAAHVSCVDVGRGQLHAKLRADKRVQNFEKINARRLEDAPLPCAQYDRIVADLSFISLKLVLPSMWSRLKKTGILIVLVKPQFEAQRQEVSKGKGVIRDEAVRARILEEIKAFALERLEGAEIVGQTASPIAGADGNREFLLGLKKN